MKVRAVQFAPALGNVEKNMAFHREKIKDAAEAGFDLIIFPELSLSGYHLKDIVFDSTLQPDSPEIGELKELSMNLDILVGAPFEGIPGQITNSALYFSNGDLLHNHEKVQLPNFGMFEERMIFKAGGEFRSFVSKGLRIGILICREILFPVHGYLHYLQKVDFLIGISNSPHRGLGGVGFVSTPLWETMGYVHSVFYHLPYVFVNRVGFEDGIGFAGGSFYARPGIGIDVRAPFFEAHAFDFKVDIGEMRRARLAGNYLRDERPWIILRELERILNA
jgi:predicted amidohydrolase